MVVTGSGVAVILKYVGLLRDHAGDPRARETQLVDVNASLVQILDRNVIQSVETVTDKLPMATVIVNLKLKIHVINII